MSFPVTTIGPCTLYHGDCLDVLRALPECSVDAVVTDPPYGLAFMGKRWDYDVPAVEVWAECLRVLKPGGHLLCFAGTRTHHRMCSGIEAAGFEIRDMIAWVYGSGFPKSLDVSKAIDKRGGNPGLTAEIGAAIRAARESRGMSASECDRLFCGGTTNWSWFEGRPVGQRAPTPETFAKIAKAWPELAHLADAVAEVEREIIGQKTSGIANKDEGERHTIGASAAVVVDITAPATDAARQWQGWGTALKPALEPITVARKPLAGTVAENVLAWGTGGLNIDGCRVGGANPDTTRGASSKASSMVGTLGAQGRIEDDGAGRWPANLIHDGSDEVTALFPDTGKSTGGGMNRSGAGNNVYGKQQGHTQIENIGFGDTGSAARFFYCAKTSKRDRGEGNAHPTVKPTALMRYLCRLVTPPGGIVLDPFMGSGSTGKAARLEGFEFTGIEREAEYLEIAAARIAAAEPKQRTRELIPV